MKEPVIATVKDRIEKAFLDLLDEKPYPEITVTDIINKAEVARVSYYRNYSSITDIVDSITDKMAGDFMTELVPVFDCKDERKLREYLFNYFYQLTRNYKRIRPEHKMNHEVIMNSLHEKVTLVEQANNIDSLEEKYTRVAKVSLLDGVAGMWVRDGMKETPEEMIDFVMKIMKSF